MLVLGAKIGEKFFVGDSSVEIVEVKNGKFRLGFNAPADVRILREKVRKRMQCGVPLHKIEDDLDHQENLEGSQR